MRIERETLIKIAEDTTKAGEGNALFVVDMEEGKTGVMVSGDIEGVLWGVSRGFRRIADLSGTSADLLAGMLKYMCDIESSPEENHIYDGVIKGGLN